MSKRAKKTARRSAPRRRRSKAKASTCVKAIKLGEARSIVYKHADGRRYRHTFKRGTFLAQSDCGRYLLIGPVQVKKFIA